MQIPYLTTEETLDELDHQNNRSIDIEEQADPFEKLNPYHPLLMRSSHAQHLFNMDLEGGN